MTGPRGRIAAALVAILGATAIGAPPVLADGKPTPRLITITIPDPKRYVPSKWLSYPGQPRADVLLPAGYDPRRAYPLVLNLGGLGGTYATSAFGASVRINALIVTPEPGSGWYVDWWNGGERSDPAWESYYLDEVLPYVLDHYRIRPGRRWHAVIGISMGGMGATYLGGRLPGFFGTVASLSGFVDPQYYAPIAGEGMGLTSFAPARGDYDLYPVLGPPHGFYAAGHNPTRLVGNLKHTRVFESTGTGVPSSANLGNPALAAAGGALEGGIIYPMNQAFHRAAVAAGVAVTYRVQAGGHDQPDFSSELAAMLRWGLFSPVATHARSWANETVAQTGRLWDVGYRFAQPPTRLVRFHRSRNLLSVSAAGSPVTITWAAGCAVRTDTPATLRLDRTCPGTTSS